MEQYSGKWLKNPQFVKFEMNGTVACITLNRPERRNALSNELLLELRDAMLEADDREDVHVVLLAGEGKDFCAGYDLVAAYEVDPVDENGNTIPYRKPSANYDNDCWNMERFQSLPNIIYELHKPVIAKIQGNCLAGGTDLAFRCDMMVAADNARIGFPATRANGSPPAHMWTYHLGPQWAKRMLMTGDMLLGRDAAKLGLVLDAVPADELDDFAMDLAQRVALIDPELNSAHKRIVNMAMEKMGMMSMQRIAVEIDARAHISSGPRRTRFRADFKESGFKAALANRDGPFGDGIVKLHTDR